MNRACLATFALSASALSACHRPALPPSTAPEKTSAPVEAKVSASPTIDEQETLTALAAQGGQVLPALKTAADIHHGATWYQGEVPADGSAAYLYLGKLGETGASTLRFVVRYEGKQRADLTNCAVIVDGTEVGSFSPALNRVDQPADGVRQLADIHFDDVRSIVVAMIDGQSAVIRTADGQEIRLGRAELDEMRRVLSAYLHLQAQPGN